MRGKGSKLGELDLGVLHKGIWDFYVRDFQHFWDSGFLHLGLFRSGKVRNAIKLSHFFKIVQIEIRYFFVASIDLSCDLLEYY